MTLSRPHLIITFSAVLASVSSSAAPHSSGTSHARAKDDNYLVYEPSDVRIGFNPALAITGAGDAAAGTTSFGGLAQILFRTSRPVPVYVGLQTGFQHWGMNTPAQFAAFGIVDAHLPSYNSIPILATGIYRFELPRTIVRPYAGLGVGIAVLTGQGDVAAGVDVNGNPVTPASVVFEGLVRPGVEFQLSRQIALFAEPAFGIMNSTFVFQSSAGMNIDL